ncbi:hypothetical protein ABVQ20_40135 [Mesorhizobium shangrilense]|uniref:Uncharacterized protein n=1 Tax=Mesorhizobium shangrilense TaxID=460060 RepID=A0ABV2DT00_9HYPH
MSYDVSDDLIVIERCDEPLALARGATRINCQSCDLENRKVWINKFESLRELIADIILTEDLGMSARCNLGETLSNCGRTFNVFV